MSNPVRSTVYLLVGSIPGVHLLADGDLGNPLTILGGIGTLVAGVVAAIALLRRQDTDAAIKSLQETIAGLRADHQACEAKHARLEGRLGAVTGWLGRNRSAMEQSGVKLEPLPNLE